jgi:hypothetical protein
LDERRWVPTFAGTTGRRDGHRTTSSPRRRGPSDVFGRTTLGSRFRRNDGAREDKRQATMCGSVGLRVLRRDSGTEEGAKCGCVSGDITHRLIAGAALQSSSLRRPREGGDPVAFARTTLGSRFRGNDGARVKTSSGAFARTTLGSRLRGNDGAREGSGFRGNDRARKEKRQSVIRDRPSPSRAPPPFPIDAAFLPRARAPSTARSVDRRASWP